MASEYLADKKPDHLTHPVFFIDTFLIAQQAGY